jgi:hypothetical protein
MTSTYPIAPQPPAVRGQVQKLFNDMKVLAGFTDHNHLMSIIGEYFNDQSPALQQQILLEAQNARIFVSTLAPFVVSQAEIRPITHQYIQSLLADPIFQANFGGMIHRFAYIDPMKIIALQPWIETRDDSIPSDELELLKFALPNTFELPAEINFIPPQGPIQILSSNPMFQGLAIDFDNINGKVTLGPPKHLNLTQVRHFQGKFYLFNGYHRLADAIQLGVSEFPCLIVEAFSPVDLFIQDPRFFNFGYLNSLARPPLVSDFSNQATIMTKIRERRYGMIISLDIKPINIGI